MPTDLAVDSVLAGDPVTGDRDEPDVVLRIETVVGAAFVLSLITFS